MFIKEGYRIAVKIEYLSISFMPDNVNLLDKPIILYETKNKIINPEILSRENGKQLPLQKSIVRPEKIMFSW